MTMEIRYILRKTMLHIVLGTDVDDMRVTMEVKDKSSGKYLQKEVSLYEATEIAGQQTLETNTPRQLNPLWRLALSCTGKNLAFTKAQRVAD